MFLLGQKWPQDLSLGFVFSSGGANFKNGATLEDGAVFFFP